MLFTTMRTELKELFAQKGIRGVVLIAKTGEVFDSWLKEDDLRRETSTLNLIEATRILAPAMLSLPEIGFQRALFHLEDTILLFTNVADRAYLTCLLNEDFNYIGMTVEANRAAYKIGRYLLNEEINTKELNQFLRATYEKTSALISSSTRTLRDNIRSQKNKKEGSS